MEIYFVETKEAGQRKSMEIATIVHSEDKTERGLPERR